MYVVYQCNVYAHEFHFLYFLNDTHDRMTCGWILVPCYWLMVYPVVVVINVPVLKNTIYIYVYICFLCMCAFGLVWPLVLALCKKATTLIFTKCLHSQVERGVLIFFLNILYPLMIQSINVDYGELKKGYSWHRGASFLFFFSYSLTPHLSIWFFP